MIISFQYDDDNYLPPAPILIAKIYIPGTRRKQRVIRLLLDTGADNSILPLTLLRELGAPYLETRRMRGVTGQAAAVDLFGVSMEIAGTPMRGVRAIGIEGSEPIAGRDILNRLVVMLNGPDETISIIAEPLILLNVLHEAEAALLEFALSLPDAFEDFPWGERNMKVGKKIFASLGMVEWPRGEKPKLRLGVKLAESHEEAMALPFTKPSGYNLGKHGWVSMWFGDSHDPPVPLLMEWIEESYRAVAPKRSVAQWQSRLKEGD